MFYYVYPAHILKWNQKVSAVKILVNQHNESRVITTDGFIRDTILCERLMSLAKTEDGKTKLGSIFFGKMPSTDVSIAHELPCGYTIVFYLHRNKLIQSGSSGLVMIRPHIYPFRAKERDKNTFAIVWQLVDQSRIMNERLLMFNDYFSRNSKITYWHVVMEENQLKLKEGYSDIYLSSVPERDCDGLVLGGETDYLILASNYEELNAIEKEFSNYIYETPIQEKDFKLAIYRKFDDTIKIVFGTTDEGNSNGAVRTWEAIHLWRPKEVIFVGMAGGDPKDNDIKIGDIVVGEEIVRYEYAIVNSSGRQKWDYEPKRLRWKASQLKEKADRLRAEWIYSLSPEEMELLERYEKNIRVHIQPIGSGNKLILSPAYFAMLQRRIESRIKAVEMEGDGVGQACDAVNKKLLMIRGIMDKCSAQTRNTLNNRKEIRSVVSKIIACFVRELLIRKI